MKNILKIPTLMIAIFTFAVFAGSVRAEEGTTTPKFPIRERVENRIDKIKVNVQQNKDERNTILEERKTEREDKKEERKEMRKDLFEARKQTIIKQLTHSIKNLKDIMTRAESRINKAKQSGRNMSEAENLLVIAKAKIVSAENAISSLATITPTNATSTTATSTPNVDLDKPRAVAGVAIKAVNDARDALKLVVRAIAKNMGLGEDRSDRNATSTNATTTNATTTTN